MLRSGFSCFPLPLHRVSHYTLGSRDSMGEDAGGEVGDNAIATRHQCGCGYDLLLEKAARRGGNAAFFITIIFPVVFPPSLVAPALRRGAPAVRGSTLRPGPPCRYRIWTEDRERRANTSGLETSCSQARRSSSLCCRAPRPQRRSGAARTPAAEPSTRGLGKHRQKRD